MKHTAPALLAYYATLFSLLLLDKSSIPRISLLSDVTCHPFNGSLSLNETAAEYNNVVNDINRNISELHAAALTTLKLRDQLVKEQEATMTLNIRFNNLTESSITELISNQENTMASYDSFLHSEELKSLAQFSKDYNSKYKYEIDKANKDANDVLSELQSATTELSNFGSSVSNYMSFLNNNMFPTIFSLSSLLDAVYPLVEPLYPVTSENIRESINQLMQMTYAQQPNAPNIPPTKLSVVAVVIKDVPEVKLVNFTTRRCIDQNYTVPVNNVGVCRRQLTFIWDDVPMLCSFGPCDRFVNVQNQDYYCPCPPTEEPTPGPSKKPTSNPSYYPSRAPTTVHPIYVASADNRSCGRAVIKKEQLCNFEKCGMCVAKSLDYSGVNLRINYTLPVVPEFKSPVPDITPIIYLDLPLSVPDLELFVIYISLFSFAIHGLRVWYDILFNKKILNPVFNYVNLKPEFIKLRLLRSTFTLLVAVVSLTIVSCATVWSWSQYQGLLLSIKQNKTNSSCAFKQLSFTRTSLDMLTYLTYKLSVVMAGASAFRSGAELAVGTRATHYISLQLELTYNESTIATSVNIAKLKIAINVIMLILTLSTASCSLGACTITVNVMMASCYYGEELEDTKLDDAVVKI